MPIPAGIHVIKFRDTDRFGWYGLVLVTKDDKSKVFVAQSYKLEVIERAEYTVMSENDVGAAARVWSESLRALSSSANETTMKLLKQLAAHAPVIARQYETHTET